MDFFYSRVSGNSARVAFALHEAGVPYTPHALNPLAGETRAPAYLAVNPMGKVPALVDGAVHLWESNAINWYLAETHLASRLLPDTPAGRASVQRWLLEGDAITLADIAYAPHLWLIAEGGFEFEATPRVRAWLGRLLARPAWQSARAMLFDA